MSNVSRATPRINPREISTTDTIADVEAFTDTIELFSKRRPDKPMLTQLRAALCRPVKIVPVIDRDVIWGHRLAVNQPNIEALHILDRWHQQHDASICRLDIAFDFDPRPDVSREEIIEWIRTNTHLRYRRNTDEVFEYGETGSTTRYAVRRAGRNNRPSKDLVFYHNRVGKLDGELDKIHLELRLLSSRTIKNAGIERPIDIIGLNPRLLLTKYVKIASTRPFLQRITQKTIEQTTPTNWIDVQQRVVSLWKRTDCDTITGFKRHYPKHAERLKPLDVLHVSNRMQWVRAGVIEQGEGMGELSCL